MRAYVRSIALAAASLSIATLPCLAQQSTALASAADQDSQLAAVAGTVVNASTGEPLKKAQVVMNKDEEIHDEHPLYAITDAAGHFSIARISPGRYNLEVRRAGYLTARYGQGQQPDRRGAVFTLAASQKISDLLFRLQRTAVISGRVQDEDGEPIRDLNVEAFRRTIVGGKPKIEAQRPGSTNDLGEYRIFDLPPGRYLIRASGTRGASFEDSGPNYPATYFPGTTEIARASAIEVKSGDEVPGIDIVIAPRPSNQTFKIHGHVLNSIPGHTDGMTVVMAIPRDNEEIESRQQFENMHPVEKGEFEIKGLAPGEYKVTAVLFTRGKARTATQTVNVVATDVEDVSLVLTRGVDIPGRVTLEGKAAAAATDAAVVLITQSEGMFNNGTDADVQSDGSFVLNEVGDGSYAIEVASSCAECYLKSARANGLDLLDQGVEVGSAGAPTSISIVYSSNSGVVNGTVVAKDDLPSPGALVVLVPDRASHRRRDRYLEAKTDQYGRFEIRGVPPGHYRAYAWESVSGDAYKDPDFLKPFESDAESLDVSENDRKSVQLKLIPASDSAN